MQDIETIKDLSNAVHGIRDDCAVKLVKLHNQYWEGVNPEDEKQVREVCKLLETFKYSDPEISRMTGVKRRYICSIRHRQLRTNISKDYKF